MGITEIIIIAIIIIFIAFLTNGWPSKRNSSSSVILALFGLLLLPVAHIIVSFYTIDIANGAIQECMINQGNLVGTALSDNLVFFSFIGETIEEHLREGYTEDMQKHLAKAIAFRKWPQILMYASLIFIFVDLFCLYFRNSDSKRFILISRFIFTIVIGFLLYSGLMLIYRISSTVLDAKTYGILSLFSGGDSFGYDILCSILGAAMFVIPLLILHIIHFKCAKRYFESEDDYDYQTIETVLPNQSTPIATIESQHVPISIQQYSQERLLSQSQSFFAKDAGGTDIEQLDELLQVGVLTEAEYNAEKSKIVPSIQNEDTKICMLRKLKNLLDADILTPEEYDKEKMEILFTEKIPVWHFGKTKVETLVEYKRLLDDGILTQEEFDYTKMDVLNKCNYEEFIKVKH